MKRLPQAILFMIVLALLARTAVNSFIPLFGKMGVTTATTSSDWTEESAGEDDSGEDEKAMSELPSFDKHIFRCAYQETHAAFFVPDHFREITVPPPQG